MNRFVAIAVLLQAIQGLPQTPPASLSGVVRDATTTTPLANSVVYATQLGNQGESRQPEARTNSEGAYRFSGLKPGRYRLQSQSAPPKGPTKTRFITLQSGQDLQSVDFNLTAHGTISGKVLNGAGQPMPATAVFLLTSHYVGATLQYGFVQAAMTDAQGAYEISNVTSGHPFVLLARTIPQTSPTTGDVPSDPQLRPPVSASTYHPATTQIENAEVVTLRPGEHRKHIDIRMKPSRSYCLDTSVEPSTPRIKTTYTLGESQPLGGLVAHISMAAHRGLAGHDGRIRVCNLPAGEYYLTVHSVSQSLTASATSLEYPTAFSTSLVKIADEDVVHFFAGATGGVSVRGKVKWESEPGVSPQPAGQLAIRVLPLRRSAWLAEQTPVRSEIPGAFHLNKLYSDDYRLILSGLPSAAYVKTITYAGRNILNDSFRPGSGSGEATLQIVLATDGGSVAAKVMDKDRKPAVDTSIFIFPATVSSERELASELVQGQTDQEGDWLSATLRPGKYRILAADQLLNQSPQTITKLWRNRDSSRIVDLEPSTPINLKLVTQSLTTLP